MSFMGDISRLKKHSLHANFSHVMTSPDMVLDIVYNFFAYFRFFDWIYSIVPYMGEMRCPIHRIGL